MCTSHYHNLHPLHLVQCFPAEKSFLTFLRNLENWLDGHSEGGKIASADYINFIEHNSVRYYMSHFACFGGLVGEDPPEGPFDVSVYKQRDYSYYLLTYNFRG